MHGETLINPNKVGGIYDVLESIPSPTPPNPSFLVTWDKVKAEAGVPVANRALTPITLELWDTTDYAAVPPNCKLYGQLGVDGAGTPTGNDPALVFGLDRPRRAAQHGQLHLGCAAHAG